MAHWVMLAYRLPREPSTPRIALWRRLRQLGAAQIGDGLVTLPLTDETRERLEWLAEQVREAGGDAGVWIAQPTTAKQERELKQRLRTAVAADYRAVLEAAEAARKEGVVTRRTVERLRRAVRAIRARDYFPPPERARAERAVETLAALLKARV